MERPILNPMLAMIEEHDASEPAKPLGRAGRLFAAVRFVFGRAWRMVRWVVRCLLSKPLARRRTGFRNEDGSFVGRFCKGLAYRMLFLPLLVAIMASAFVFSGTHPKSKAVELDPSSSGLYYDPVAFTSADGTHLEAWIVPVVSAKEVLAKKEKMLRAKHPAVLLVHDFGKCQQQMLPLLAPLQEDGIVTMTLALRGSVPGPRVGQTFGLRESEDVSAAIALLRNRPFVDPERIAILGIGTGATAAVRAAAKDPSVQLLVLLSPPADAREVLARRVGPQRVGLQWMQPFCKWAFELGYSVDAEEISLDRYAKVMENRAALLLDKDADLGRAREVLRLGLVDKKKETVHASAAN
jgi:hypothetical protein